MAMKTKSYMLPSSNPTDIHLPVFMDQVISQINTNIDIGYGGGGNEEPHGKERDFLEEEMFDEETKKNTYSLW